MAEVPRQEERELTPPAVRPPLMAELPRRRERELTAPAAER